MRILFIGGTGNLSLPCTVRALEKGHDVVHLNRGRNPDDAGSGVKTITADIHDEPASAKALAGHHFDVVVDFIAFTPEEVQSRIRLFKGLTGQYLFISSTAAYKKPPVEWLLDESTPLGNPFWPYAQAKADCENQLMAEYRQSGFPVTIVRPSHTYGRGWVPSPFSSGDFTVAARMMAGKRIIIPGDGQSIWTLTHARDFAAGLVGLLGHPEAIGEAVQITGDEAMTWEAIHHLVASAIGVELRAVHIPTDFIAKVDPALGEAWLGDKANSCVFDCSKLKRLVPGFKATIPLHEGVREALAWRLADPERMRTDGTMDKRIEAILTTWDRGMAAAFPAT